MSQIDRRARLRRALQPASLLLATALATAAPAAARPDSAPARVEPAAGFLKSTSALPLVREAPDRDGTPLATWFLLAALASAGIGLVWLRRRRTSVLPSSARGLLAALGRWTAPGAGGARLQVVQSVQLRPRASLHVVTWDGKEWLVGCSDGGVSVLGSRAVDAVADGKPQGPLSGGDSCVSSFGLGGRG